MYKQLGLVDKARPTGDAAFRVMIPIDQMNDPELQAFASDPVGTRWMGPGRHVQGYPIRHGNLYNMVSSLIDLIVVVFLTGLERYFAILIMEPQ